MTIEEAKLFLNCEQQDLDCYQNEVFKLKQKLLSSHQHQLLLKKTSDQTFNKSMAAVTLGFKEQKNEETLSSKKTQIHTIEDLINSYRVFDQELSEIKLKISQSENFINIKESVDQWIAIIKQRTETIYKDIISLSDNFFPKPDVKRSTPLHSGEIIMYLTDLDLNNKINDQTLSLLLKSPYIYDDFSIIYTENKR